MLPNETYYIGAMYTGEVAGTTVYGDVEVGETPVLIPAGEIHGLHPGQEVIDWTH